MNNMVKSKNVIVMAPGSTYLNVLTSAIPVIKQGKSVMDIDPYIFTTDIPTMKYGQCVFNNYNFYRR